MFFLLVHGVIALQKALVGTYHIAVQWPPAHRRPARFSHGTWRRAPALPALPWKAQVRAQVLPERAMLTAQPRTPLYAQKLVVVKLFRFCVNILGLKTSGVMIESRLLVGIGRSGVMIGRICLDKVS